MENGNGVTVPENQAKKEQAGMVSNNSIIWAGAAVAITGIVVFGGPQFIASVRGSQNPAMQQPAPYAQSPEPYRPAPYAQATPPPYQPQYWSAPPVTAPPPPAPQPTVAANDQIRGTGPLALAGLQPDDGFELGDTSIVQVIKDKIIPNLLSVLDVPPSIKDANANNTIVMFLDPRCRYCHAAHKYLVDSGKYAVRYVPMSVLGGDEVSMTQVEPMIRGIVRAADPAAALTKYMDTSSEEGLNTAPDDALAQQMIGNKEVWLSLAANMPNKSAAVPMFMVPQASGKMAVFTGWTDSTPQIIDALLNKSN